MQAPCYQDKYSVTCTQYNQDPYNRGDFNNGWPDNVGAPSYFTDDLGTSLRSRFSFPSAPWSGSDDAMLDIFVRYGTITNLGREYFDPPEGFVFIGPALSGDPWRQWESSYEYTVIGGPYAWDTYVYRASGIYIVPFYRTIITATAPKGAGGAIVPIIAALTLLIPSSLMGSAATPPAPGRRKKRNRA
jgi:hypothetical protein